MQQQHIKLILTLDEVNTILAGLSHMPYGQVSELFDKIKTDAAVQLEVEPEIVQ